MLAQTHVSYCFWRDGLNPTSFDCFGMEWRATKTVFTDQQWILPAAFYEMPWGQQRRVAHAYCPSRKCYSVTSHVILCDVSEYMLLYLLEIPLYTVARDNSQ